ncbi:galectin-9-like [Molossus nigricans]
MDLINAQISFVNPIIICDIIQEGLWDGLQVIVGGKFLWSHESRFAVNFQIGHSDSDIAFHFNPRFEDGGYVVCNTKQRGYWGSEERKMGNPFKRGIPFEIRFLVQNSQFQVMVNGNFFTQYTHRVPIHRVDTISFTGGVAVNHISFQNTRGVPFQPASPAAKFPQITWGPSEPKEHKTKVSSSWRTWEAGALREVVPASRPARTKAPSCPPEAPNLSTRHPAPGPGRCPWFSPPSLTSLQCTNTLLPEATAWVQGLTPSSHSPTDPSPVLPSPPPHLAPQDPHAASTAHARPFPATTLLHLLSRC